MRSRRFSAALVVVRRRGRKTGERAGLRSAAVFFERRLDASIMCRATERGRTGLRPKRYKNPGSEWVELGLQAGRRRGTAPARSLNLPGSVEKALAVVGHYR